MRSSKPGSTCTVPASERTYGASAGSDPGQRQLPGSRSERPALAGGRRAPARRGARPPRDRRLHGHLARGSVGSHHADRAAAARRGGPPGRRAARLPLLPRSARQAAEAVFRGDGHGQGISRGLVGGRAVPVGHAGGVPRPTADPHPGLVFQRSDSRRLEGPAGPGTAAPFRQQGARPSGAHLVDESRVLLRRGADRERCARCVDVYGRARRRAAQRARGPRRRRADLARGRPQIRRRKAPGRRRLADPDALDLRESGHDPPGPYQTPIAAPASAVPVPASSPAFAPVARPAARPGTAS